MATGIGLYQNSASRLTTRVKNNSIFPLAKLAPLGILSAIALISTLFVISTDKLANGWIAIGLLPLILYLATCHIQARQQLLADTGREREIVRAGFVVMAAERAVQFWGAMFSSIVVATGAITAGIWSYQGFLWYEESRWIPMPWFAVTGVLPSLENTYLQRLVHWLADTNMGVVVLILGLLLAAPLAAVHWRSNNKAKFRRNDLANLKKRS